MTILLSSYEDFGSSLSLWTLLGFLACFWPLKTLVSNSRINKRIDVFKAKWSLNSWYIACMLWTKDSTSVQEQAYIKYANKAYQLPRLDGDMIILPPSAVQEISSLPPHIANRSKALDRDLCGAYNGIGLILETSLHEQVIKRRIIPKLATLQPLLEEELDMAVKELVLPKLSGAEWTTVELHHLILPVIARVAARAFVGTAFCRNQEWLDTSVSFVEDVFSSAALLRLFPPWMHLIVGRILPGYWRSKSYYRKAAKILGPYIQAKLDEKAGKETTSSNTIITNNEACGLNWLVDIASAEEANAERIAQAEVLLAFAGVHTILTRNLTTILDLAANPRYIPSLRDEIVSVSSTDWTRSSYHQLTKLDSVIRESQRVNPTSTLTLKRIMEVPYTLHDGTHLPKGAYICVDAWGIENDPKFVPDPELFDGLRGHRANLAEGPDSMKHSFTSTEPTVLGFGHGRTACPGKHLAGLLVKMCMVKWLSEFDFEFLPGKQRPKNFLIHEFVVLLPWWKVRVRRREGSSICPF